MDLTEFPFDGVPCHVPFADRHVSPIPGSHPFSVPQISISSSTSTMPTTPIQVTYLTIGILALLPIYFGSFASLKVCIPPCLSCPFVSAFPPLVATPSRFISLPQRVSQS